MRFAGPILALAVALSGCTLAVPPAMTPAQPAGLTPDAFGLQPAGTDLRIDFGRAQAGVIETVSRLLGDDPSDVTTNRECGAGAVTAARWPNGLTLNFLDGDFRGWVVDEPGLSPAGLQVGQAPPSVPMTDTSLGREFERDGVWALVLPDRPGIAAIWSGTSCFFR